MQRLIHATLNSARALRYLLRHEAAFRQEFAAFVLAVPAAWLLAGDLSGFLLLIGSILLILMVEALNTGIEAACNAVSRERDADIRIAKDCGSLAVAIAILIAAGVWGLALAERWPDWNG